MADPIADVLAAPIEQVLVALASGIGRAQKELDRHSLETQKSILEDPVLSQLGIDATWYQIPRADLELKMTVVLERRTSSGTSPPAPEPTWSRLPRLWAQPVNPRLTNQFSVDTTAVSTVKLAIVAVPPPGAASTPPVQTTENVRGIADPHLLKQPDGSFTGRVSVNYNGALRAWFIVQTEETAGATELRTAIKIDDESGKIVSQTGGV